MGPVQFAEKLDWIKRDGFPAFIGHSLTKDQIIDIDVILAERMSVNLKDGNYGMVKKLIEFQQYCIHTKRRII